MMRSALLTGAILSVLMTAQLVRPASALADGTGSTPSQTDNMAPASAEATDAATPAQAPMAAAPDAATSGKPISQPGAIVVAQKRSADVPEPGGLILVGSGLLGLWEVNRLRRRTLLAGPSADQSEDPRLLRRNAGRFRAHG